VAAFFRFAVWRLFAGAVSPLLASFEEFFQKTSPICLSPSFSGFGWGTYFGLFRRPSTSKPFIQNSYLNPSTIHPKAKTIGLSSNI
jgi:hypothetical protein